MLIDWMPVAQSGVSEVIRDRKYEKAHGERQSIRKIGAQSDDHPGKRQDGEQGTKPDVGLAEMQQRNPGINPRVESSRPIIHDSIECIFQEDSWMGPDERDGLLLFQLIVIWFSAQDELNALHLVAHGMALRRNDFFYRRIVPQPKFQSEV